MPELVDQMYCSQQIVIPPKFPYILKRYCKAAIKTQPYDLLRWSFEYFKALAHHRPPPVKMRLEYPIYSTEGGLTRGCLKVLANQVCGTPDVPVPVLKAAWQGFCLDPVELKRIMCLCEVYKRSETVPSLHFLAVAGGLLTKCLTHTMILVCECLTKEPDGGSAAIPVESFLTMYRFLAQMEASCDVKYFNGYREGHTPKPESVCEEGSNIGPVLSDASSMSEEFWEDSKNLHKLTLIDDNVTRSARLSVRMNMPVIGKIERSPSVERDGQIERENYLRERKGRPVANAEVDEKLREMSTIRMSGPDTSKPDSKVKEEKKVEKKDGVQILVFDEDGNEIPFGFYGEPNEESQLEEEDDDDLQYQSEEIKKDELDERDKVNLFVAECLTSREERLEDLNKTFDELAAIVDRWTSANYDLGMIAGRQMSTTSGEFVVHSVEREIMDYIDEQIAVLPDPDLKKKKAKPEEVEMIRDMLERFLDENMDIIAPELEEAEEEELPVPEVIVVNAVPGIGPPADADIIRDFEEYARDVCKVQADVFMPRNIRHFLCPPLEKYEEHHYEDQHQKGEELPIGGAITD